MKNLDLTTFGVEEMTNQEMITVDGGGPWWWDAIKTGLAYDLLKGLAEKWAEFAHAYMEGHQNGTYDTIPGCKR